jgi:hypothetical protein
MRCIICFPAGCGYTNCRVKFMQEEVPAVSTVISSAEAPTKHRSNGKGKPAAPEVKWPSSIAELAPQLAALGIQVTEIVRADTRVFSTGKWAIHCFVPKSSPVPASPDFPSLGMKRLAYDSQAVGKGTRLTVILGT